MCWSIYLNRYKKYRRAGKTRKRGRMKDSKRISKIRCGAQKIRVDYVDA